MPPTEKGAKMDTLNKMKEKITYLLEKYPKLRDDDFLLIGAVYSQFYNVENSDSFLEIMKHHDERHLPSFESIRRTRQKVQEERLDLCSSKAKQLEKEKSFARYYDFAKQKKKPHDVDRWKS
jgi:L-fucose isomerase-like protein